MGNFDDDANGFRDDIFEWDFFNIDDLPLDENGHGTLVASIVASAAVLYPATYYSANIKGDIKQLNSLWDGESKDLMAWRRIPSSAYRPGSRASRLSMPE